MLVWNILILVFVFVAFNTARIGSYCNMKPKLLCLEHYYSFGVGAPSTCIWSCAPKYGKRINLTAKEIIIQMSSRYRRNFAASLFLFAVRFFCFETFSFCHEVFLFAASLFLLAARWGYSFSREVFLFAVRLMLLPWQLWATILRWGKQQAIGEDTERNDLSIISKLNACVKYSDSCICFRCVQYC